MSVGVGNGVVVGNLVTVGAGIGIGTGAQAARTMTMATIEDIFEFIFLPFQSENM